MLLYVFLPDRGRVEVKVDFETADLTIACFVVNLAEFCFEMLDRAVWFVFMFADFLDFLLLVVGLFLFSCNEFSFFVLLEFFL